ncbi:universal stress protein [Microvirga terrestris]|uniref:universal stress protein n=1 Tax=Microvirga terrestris TaxID=2791024 RepID=UPI0031BB4B95
MSAGEMPPLPIADPYGINVDGEILRMEEEDLRKSLQAAETKFWEQPACKKVPAAWRSTIGSPSKIVAQEARAADVVIAGRDLQRLKDEPYQTVDPGDLLMRLGRPLLVVPPGTDYLEAQHVVIGWKDTREARRAVWDALPLLVRADHVKVAEIVEREHIDAAVAQGDAIVLYLERHGVKADAEVRTQRERSVADELLLVAEQTGSDLLVVGGYGHTRLREWVLGGVTGDLLKHSPKCCFFSH